MNSILDQLHRTLNYAETPKRIISLVPSQTELLCDLGLEENLVGITKFCVHPNHLKATKTIVGGTKKIQIEKIKALNPDIILCNKEENSEAIVNMCEQICNVHVSDIFNTDDCLDMIHQYGILFDKVQASIAIQTEIKQELKSFEIFVRNLPKKKVAYFIWKDPWMVAAKNTYLDYILQINGYDNIFKALERYPEIQLEQLKALNPEVLLLSSEPYPFKENHIKELQELFPSTQIQLVDGEMFSWYGSRLKKAFKYFKDLRNNL